MNGQLNDQPLVVLIREIYLQRLDGVIRLKHNEVRTVIYFEAGEIIYAVANLRELRLIQYIRKQNLLSDEELGAFVRANAWGHHASGSCTIGPKETNGVLDSKFRVHGVSGLRVVDASVFPRIPGFFIASAVYMVGEKAADIILADARTTASA